MPRFRRKLDAIVMGSGVIDAIVGGTGQEQYEVGDTLYADTPKSLARLAAGTTGQVYVVDGDGVPSWGGIRKSHEGWYQDNVAANQNDVVLSRYAGVAFADKAFAVRAGSIVAVWVKSSEARTAGTLTVDVFVEGISVGFTAVLDGTNTTYKLTTQAADNATFSAGDEIDVRVTTDSSWAPTTADIRVGIEIEE